MKSTDFKSGQNSIRVLNDIKPQNKKVNWDRTIYLVILGILLLYIIFLVLRSILLVQGEGQVLFRKLDIQYPEDIQISEIFVNEGDTVNIGDTLFQYNLNKFPEREKVYSNTSRVTIVDKADLSWLDKEILQTRNDIYQSRIDTRSKLKLLTKTKDDIRRMKEAILLDIYTVDKLDNLTTRQVQLESEIDALKEETSLLNTYMLELQIRLSNMERHIADINNPDYSFVLTNPVENHQVYVSPVKGTITKINKENFEVAMKSEIIMSIHKPANLFIKVFYDQKSLKHVNAGDKVLIVFPDGALSHGILERFYFATYQLPDELQKKYEPITRSIAADIYPIDEAEIEKWKAFYKLNVQIYKWKYW